MATPRKRRDRGASLVEFALILPVLVMLLLGMITGGIALNDKQQMTHATREGARYAAVVPHDQTFDDGGTWASNVQALIVARSQGTLETADICVSLVYGNPGTVVSAAHTTNAGAPCIASQPYPTDLNSTRVQVTSSRDATIQLGLFGAYDVTLQSDATAKAETEADRP